MRGGYKISQTDYCKIYRMCTFLNVMEALEADILKNMMRNKKRKRKTFNANLKVKACVITFQPISVRKTGSGSFHILHVSSYSIAVHI